MPLIKGKSDKAFSKNVEAEMHAGKPQKQSLAIAFSVQRQARKKKYAKGGEVPISAKTESRQTADNSETSENTKTLEGRRASKAQTAAVTTEGKSSADNSSTSKDFPSRLTASKKQTTSFGTESEAKADNSVTDEEMDMIRHHRAMKSQELSATDADQHVGEDTDPTHKQRGFAHGGIAEAIMRKRAYADGGEVDIESNGEEEPAESGYDKQNAYAGMKENYDDGLKGIEQPWDSNETGDDIDSDEHDMISKLRERIKSRRGF